MTPDEMAQAAAALNHDPSPFEQVVFLRLKKLLGRQPLDNEIGNMMSDNGLILLVLSGQ